MNYNICIAKPANYIHSAAFAELAELVMHGLRDLGYVAHISLNNIDPASRNIIIGCHLLDPSLIARTPKDSIIINTEQIAADDTAWNDRIFKWVTAFETWDYSQRNLDKLEEIGAINPKLLRLGYHAKLARINKAGLQDIDVLFYGAINDRRRQVLKALKSAGLTACAVFGVYGAERDRLISRSKVVLNHHFYTSQIFEIVRVFYLMTNSKAVVGEVSENTIIDNIYQDGIFTRDYDNLVDGCISLVRDDVSRHALEARSLTTIQKLPQHALLRPLL